MPTDPPTPIKNLDLETTDRVVRAYLTDVHLDHPTRGPFITSADLFDAVDEEIDDRFTPQFFGMFCESRTYLEQWTRGYGGSYQYRILADELDPPSRLADAD